MTQPTLNDRVSGAFVAMTLGGLTSEASTTAAFNMGVNPAAAMTLGILTATLAGVVGYCAGAGVLPAHDDALRSERLRQQTAQQRYAASRRHHLTPGSL